MRSGWRFFPLAVTAGIGVVVAVNAGMVYAALQSAPGKVGEGFALSNRYGAVLAEAEREGALGWTVKARAEGDGRPAVTLTDRDAAPLRGASVAAIARRPLGPPEMRTLVFRESDAGRYVADAALPVPGQWDLTLSASVARDTVAVTRRVIVH
jgi:nitrogen fixation protein FixH